MEAVNAVVGKIVEQITEHLLRSVGRQIGYLVHSKENIEKLVGEIEKLGDDGTTVQGKVDRARQNGEIIEDDVWKWLTRVHGLKLEVGGFLEDKTVIVDKRCFKGCCPDVRSRYWLGKEAQKKMMLLAKLKEEGQFDRVGHDAPPPEIGFTSATVYDHFESRASLFKEIWGALEDDTINIIGISGMGGVGKTTMVTEIGQQAKKDMLFDEVVQQAVCVICCN
uniref:NB-ARC domain-containing protein n=1 Tax=Davidia involucrata TaxID=16924 RepID=A0A5B7A372_DAVIN